MKTQVLVVSQDKEFITQIKKMGQYEFTVWPDLDTVDIEQIYHFPATVIDGRKFEANYLAGSAQVVSTIVPGSKIILVVNNRMFPEDIRFIYQSGVDLIVSENEVVSSQKIIFFLHHYLHNTYIPIKSYEIDPQRELEFTIFHLISFRGTYVPVNSGKAISESKWQKLQQVNELYIKVTDLSKFIKYLENTEGKTEQNILSRCRAKFIEFYEAYVQLLFQVTDNSKIYSYDEGKELLANIETMANELLKILMQAPNPWLIVNNLSNEKQASSLTRMPAVAAYVGIACQDLGWPSAAQVMMATILSDVGLLFEPMGTYQTSEQYNHHPLASINLVLERKIPLSNEVKNYIINSHENLMGTGFPKGAKVNFDKIPKEAQLMQICQLLDDRLLIKPGTMRPNVEGERNQLLEQLSTNRIFDLQVITQLSSRWVKVA